MSKTLSELLFLCPFFLLHLSLKYMKASENASGSHHSDNGERMRVLHKTYAKSEFYTDLCVPCSTKQHFVVE